METRIETNEWIAAGFARELSTAAVLEKQVAGTPVRIWRDHEGVLHCAALDPAGRIQDEFDIHESFGLLWVFHGKSASAFFAIPEFQQSGRRIVDCGSFGVRTSPLRAVENFLDLAHFPFVHTDVLGSEPYTEVLEYRTEIRSDPEEIWAIQCKFTQPKSNVTATQPQVVDYTYRVVNPFNVLLYKSSFNRPSENDVVCLFIQPITETEIVAHMTMALIDDVSTMAQMIAFQQSIFGQDKPILENHVPLLMPLEGRTETPARGDASSVAYRRWLKRRDWQYGAQKPAVLRDEERA